MQREAFSGDADYNLYRQPAAPVVATYSSVKELQPYFVDGRPYYLLRETDQPPKLVDIEGHAVEKFPQDFLLAAARRAVPQGHIVEQVLLPEYDAYYYDREWRSPLPVLRVKFDDPERSWLYIDIQRGSPVARYERSGRINRWLYQGLHHLDFPFLWSLAAHVGHHRDRSTAGGNSFEQHWCVDRLPPLTDCARWLGL